MSILKCLLEVNDNSTEEKMQDEAEKHFKEYLKQMIDNSKNSNDNKNNLKRK